MIYGNITKINNMFFLVTRTSFYRNILNNNNNTMHYSHAIYELGNYV